MSPDAVKTPSTFKWLWQMSGAQPRRVRGLLGFSFAVNLLLMVSPLYMLQIYDRVLSSGSAHTLIWMTVIAVFLLTIYAAAEAGRRRLAAIAGAKLDAALSEKAFARFESALDPPTALPRDLSNVSKVQSPYQHGTLLAFFDLPFAPLFIGVLFLIHPLLGWLSVGGALIVFTVAALSEWLSRKPAGEVAVVHARAGQLAEGLARQRSALVAMGLVGRAYDTWKSVKQEGDAQNARASRSDSAFTAISRGLRQILQVFILGAGAALALSQQLSPGGIVAASIILSRALAPIDMIVGSWRSIVQAKTAWGDVHGRLGHITIDDEKTPLPAPKARLDIDRLSVTAPGSEIPLIRPFSVTLEEGTLVGVVGANGSGKTTLLQTLAGAWPLASGSADLGGRSIHNWPSADRGRHMGYVPQDVELFPGTVAQNISRFGSGSAEEMFAAAQLAGAHDLILGLPDGYDTLVGPGGVHLSAGQRQLIGMARAFFGSPVLMLLDEPTANLDADAAGQAIHALKSRVADGAIVLVASHDPRLLAEADIVFTVNRGAIVAQPVNKAAPPSKIAKIREIKR
ncbi:MAG: ATP-binding cassette domain-containing protein [Pseudomonadota bacterium]